MMILPVFMRVKVRHGAFATPTLWLPLFLLWPLVFLMLIALFFFGLIFIFIFDSRSAQRFGLLFAGLYRTLCEFRGTRVDVETPTDQVLVVID